VRLNKKGHTFRDITPSPARNGYSSSKREILHAAAQVSIRI